MLQLMPRSIRCFGGIKTWLVALLLNKQHISVSPVFGIDANLQPICAVTLVGKLIMPPSEPMRLNISKVPANYLH